LLVREALPDPTRDERFAVLKEQLEAGVRDQDFVAQFEEIRVRAQSQVHVDEGRFASEAAYPAIGEALRRYGIEISVTPAEQAAARVQGRPEAVRQQLLAALDECLNQVPQGDSQARQWLLATLKEADNDPWRVRVRKGIVDRDWTMLEPLAQSVDVRTQPPSFLLIVGKRLPEQMKSTRMDLFRKIQRAYPADLWANHELADELLSNGQPAEAVRYHTAALALRPDSPGIWVNRGIALQRAGELDAAIADARQALVLAPQYAKAHSNLAFMLMRNHQLAEAIVEYRKYFGREAGNAACHYNFGNALKTNGEIDEAIVEYRKAISLKSDFAHAYFNLGQCLVANGQLDQAIKELSEAVRFETVPNPLGPPNVALNHYGLGDALYRNGQLDKAIAEYREALRLEPDFAEARKSLLQAERLARLDTRLPAVLQPKDQPKDAGVCLDLAELCMLPHRKQYGCAAWFFGEAFAMEPNLVDDLQAPHRYNAACAAALAACGQGKDADKLDEKERARLRRQALDWLRAELDAWRLLLAKDADGAGPILVREMRNWLATPDFAGVRGQDALASLPEAERQEWQKLWTEVAELRKRALENPAAKKSSDEM
jgi:Tfp pilus assembly protein PilF